jgi:hypothetical protein
MSLPKFALSKSSLLKSNLLQTRFLPKRYITNTMASNQQKSAVGQTISEIAKAEGVSTQGSVSAQLQSKVTKAMNEKGAVHADEPGPAGAAISAVSDLEGGPSKGWLSGLL